MIRVTPFCDSLVRSPRKWPFGRNCSYFSRKKRRSWGNETFSPSPSFAPRFPFRPGTWNEELCGDATNSAIAIEFSTCDQRREIELLRNRFKAPAITKWIYRQLCLQREANPPGKVNSTCVRASGYSGMPQLALFFRVFVHKFLPPYNSFARFSVHAKITDTTGHFVSLLSNTRVSECSPMYI